MTLDAIAEGTSEVVCDVLVIGGGTAGPMAALKAKQKNPKAKVGIEYLPPQQIIESILAKEARIVELMASIKNTLAEGPR